jgi:hypothetical protein
MENFIYYILLLLVAVGAFLIGAFLTDRDWLDHAFYGEVKKINGRQYKVIETKKRII